MRLLLVIFLGTITLIRRAQKNIFTKLEASSSSLLGILPHDEQGLNLRNSVHEGNIQRVIAILQGNIKQWSFIEAQLLEPNVNLAMPEIFIPLKHLTTTLEILGNIFFMKSEWEEARKCLERACPLMELLPSSIVETTDAMGGGGSGGIDEFSFLPDNEIDESIREQILISSHHHHSPHSHSQSQSQSFHHSANKNYANDCFQLLRNVYFKLYGLNTTSPSTTPEDEDSSTASDSNSQKSRDTTSEEEDFEDFDGEERDAEEELRFSGSYDDIPFEEDEFLTPASPAITSHSQSLSEDSHNQQSLSEIEAMIEELRSPFQHLRSELKLVQNQGFGVSHEEGEEEDEDGLSDDPVIRELPDDNHDHNNDNDPLEEEERARGFAKSRSRSSSFSRQSSHYHHSPHSPPPGTPTPSHHPTTTTTSTSTGNTNTGSHGGFWSQVKRWTAKALSVFSLVSPNRDSSPPLDPLLDSERGRGSDSLERDQRERLLATSTAFQELSGSATAIIASDLEEMLRKFVREDEEGRRDVYDLVRRYYDDLEANYPQMDENEFAANMDLGLVYLEVMGRVVKEGFGFVGPELEKWQDIGHHLVSRQMRTNTNTESETSYGVGIIWEIDPETGAKQEFAVELDGSYFDAFSLPERNRLLVLSAFDIALNLEPYEQFDLSLGFGLGILDNDRSRQRDHTALSFYHQTAPNQQPHLLNVQKPLSGRDYSSPSHSDRDRDRDREKHTNTKTSRSKKASEKSQDKAHPSRSVPSATKSKSKTTTATTTPSPPVPSSNNKPDPEVEASMFMEQTSATLEIPAALRSSVPMIKLENDWTLFLLLSFVLITVFIVYLAYYQDLKKRLVRQRASTANVVTRTQKKTSTATAAGSGSTSNSNEGSGVMEILVMIAGDLSDFLVPILSFLLTKSTALLVDLMSAVKLGLSRLVVQLSLSLRERREMIFPNHHNHHNHNSSASVSPISSLPSSKPSPATTTNTTSSTGSQSKRGPTTSHQTTTRTPPTSHSNSNSNSTNTNSHRSNSSSKALPVVVVDQAWQQISTNHSINTSITVEEKEDSGLLASSQRKKGSTATTTTASEVNKSPNTSNKSVSGATSSTGGKTRQETQKAVGTESSSSSSSAEDDEEEGSSDSEDPLVAALSQNKKGKPVKSPAKSLTSTNNNKNREKTGAEETLLPREISEDNLYSQPEKYEAIVSSLLAEGQWKQAKKKGPKKEKSSTGSITTSTSTSNSHTTNGNGSTASSNSTSNLTTTSMTPPTASTMTSEGKEKEKKTRPLTSNTSQRAKTTNATATATVSEGLSRKTTATTDHPTTATTHSNTSNQVEKKSSAMTLSLDSMLPPAILEHKPSSLPPMNPITVIPPRGAWKPLPPTTTTTISTTATSNSHKKTPAVSSPEVLPVSSSDLSRGRATSSTSNLSESETRTPPNSTTNTITSKSSPDLSALTSSLPAMPALLPSAKTGALVAGHGLTARDRETAVTETSPVGVAMSTNPSTTTTHTNPPPGLLPMSARPHPYSYHHSSSTDLSYSRQSTNTSSLLSSLLGGSASTGKDSSVVGVGSASSHQTSQSSSRGLLVSQSEEDNDSNELLRGMLDDILRPASPPLVVEGLFSKQSTTSTSHKSDGEQQKKQQSSSSSFLYGNGIASMDDLISDLSPNAPVFQPLTASSGLTRPFPLQGSYYDSSSAQQYLETSSLSNLGHLAGEGLWSFNTSSSNTFSSSQSYLLGSLGNQLTHTAEDLLPLPDSSFATHDSSYSTAGGPSTTTTTSSHFGPPPQQRR